MSTDLMIYQHVSDPLAFMREAGTVLAKSRMFGCQTIEQGQALALISMTEQLPFLELRRRYHIINGNLTMRADFMRADFRRLGGEYKWLNLGEDGQEAKALWTYKGESYEIGYTIQEAEKEGLVKEGSRWEKAPGDMLRARCSTKAIRAIASEVLAGFYTEEELGHVITENGGKANGSKKVKTAAPSRVKTSPATSDDVVDVEATVVATDPPKAQVPPPGDMCSAQQSSRIKELWGLLKATPEQRDKMLKSRNVTAVRSLTADQASELIGKLEAKLTSMSPPTQHEEPQPCGEEFAQQLRAKIGEVNQRVPGIAARLRAKFEAAGITALAAIRLDNARVLMSGLSGSDIEAFFGQDLWKPIAAELVAAEVVEEPAKN